MGIFRDLVSNYANAKMKEEQQKLQHNLVLGDVLTTLIKNPDTDPATLTKASSLYKTMLFRHGGKEGKEIQGQIDQLLGGLIGHRTQQKAQEAAGGPQDQGGAGGPSATQPQQGEPTVAPGGGPPPERPVPPGQTPGQPGGVNYGWDTGPALPAALAGTAGGEGSAPAGTGGAQDGRHGFGRVLGGLAGVGKEMLGIPRQQGGMLTPTPEQIARVYGPTEVEQAREKKRGLLAAEEIDRQAYVARLHKDVDAGLITKEEADQAEKELDITGRPPTEPRAAGARPRVDLIYPDGTRTTLEQDHTGAFYDAMGQRVIPPAGTHFAPSRAEAPGVLGELEEARKTLASNAPEYKKQAAKDLIDKYTREPTAVISAKEADTEADDIAAAIVRGEQDPNLTGLSRGGVAAKVRDRLAKQNYNLLRAQNDLYAMRRWMAAMNSAQQVRLREATDFTLESLDVLDNRQSPGSDLIGKLRKAVPLSKFPVLNRAAIAAAENGIFGDDAADAARLLQTQIGDLQSELAVVYMGGNSPTDKGLGQAQGQLRGEWSEKVLRDSIGLARTNLGLRLNSIRRTGPVGISPQGQEQYNVNPLSPPSPPPPPPPPPPSGPVDKKKRDPAGIR